jgi:hypothetical protein
MNDYKLYQSDYIITHQQDFISQCQTIRQLLNEDDPTRAYYKYNVFAITAGSIQFYNLFKELRNIIRAEIPNTPLWFQAWINLHTQDNVLDWHNHSWDYHGYIAIDPKDSTTEFEGYNIQNKIGQIYFGPGNRTHKVTINTPYSGERITIGYDITLDPIMGTGCLGLMPLL